MIVPTIGRRVWYWPNIAGTPGYQGFAYTDTKQACDAGIAYVFNDRKVNLTVSDHEGVVHVKREVLLLQHGDEKPAPGIPYAEWMPYQIGQAEKQEATGETAEHRDASA